MLQLPGHTAQEALNFNTVLRFYDAGLNQKESAEACRFLGDSYRQHNPNAADGVEGFRRFVDNLREMAPQSRSEVERVFVDGEYVILHVHKVVEPETRGFAIIDIFRLEAGKIVEHWDVTQAIPESTVSGNPMI